MWHGLSFFLSNQQQFNYNAVNWDHSPARSDWRRCILSGVNDRRTDSLVGNVLHLDNETIPLLPIRNYIY